MYGIWGISSEGNAHAWWTLGWVLEASKVGPAGSVVVPGIHGRV
jgi:hypothetical protein